ncbi:hypothetical protein BCR44DRAFT_1138203 [Catenaria anguillulae PL171]|uniref:Uncharacterized protein n=1 Tax=Catenaria anguillulae PL171 TaxID=765915 RepID=A0A1Y2HLU6_9FUNG|nr:hypothetical protein BCR44DRAFT_1138203 [Catenaria anguillulae PL171]
MSGATCSDSAVVISVAADHHTFTHIRLQAREARVIPENTHHICRSPPNSIIGHPSVSHNCRLTTVAALTAAVDLASKKPHRPVLVKQADQKGPSCGDSRDKFAVCLTSQGLPHLLHTEPKRTLTRRNSSRSCECLDAHRETLQAWPALTRVSKRWPKTD